MQTTKKKPSLIFILVGAVLAGYLGYLINGAWTEGIAFNEFMDRFNEVCAVPFANYYNSNTVKLRYFHLSRWKRAEHAQVCVRAAWKEKD